MQKNIKIYEGKIQKDIFGSWADCSPGLYLDSDKVEQIFNDFQGKTVRVTIEEINPPP